MAVAQRTLGPERAHTGPSPRPASGEGSATLRRVLFGLDAAALACAWLLTYWQLPGPPGALGVATAMSRVAAVTAVSLLLLMAQRLYRARVCAVRGVEVTRLARAAGGGALFAFWASGPAGGDATMATAVVGGTLSMILLSGARSFYDAWLRAERARGRFIRRVAVVGRGEEAERVIDLLRHHPDLGYRVCGLVGDQAAALKHGLAWLGGHGSAADEVVASGATGVVLVAGGMLSQELRALMGDLLARGLHIQVSAGLWQVGHRRLRAAPLAHEPFFYLEPSPLSSGRLRIKRALDLLVVVPALVLSAPVGLLAALAVKLGDGGPVLFRQTRIGQGGRPFTLLKFRSMSVDAEARLADLRARNRRQGPLFKVDDDPRVTRVGRFLRATSVDELPQLFNVLTGSMSMVGPRPALPEEVATFDADLQARHCVPPGITGLWQLEARENASFYAYRHLDLFYVENWSWALDLMILAATLPFLVARLLRSVLGRAAIVTEAGERERDRTPRRLGAPLFKP